MADLDGNWLVFTHRARGFTKSIDHDSHLKINGTNIVYLLDGQPNTVPTTGLTIQPDGYGFRRERPANENSVRIGGFIWQSNGGWLMTGYIGRGTGPGGPTSDEHRPAGDDNTDTFTAVKTS